jgi:quinol monooxygenase YgiN
MRARITFIALLFAAMVQAQGLYRLAEIEVHPQYLKENLAAAAEIQKASLAEEPGVVCLFPTQTKEDSTQTFPSEARLPVAFRILEIYASQEAYQHHIKTAHFQKYKQGTLHMVKHLKLNDLQPLTPETMNMIFKRIDTEPVTDEVYNKLK